MTFVAIVVLYLLVFKMTASILSQIFFGHLEYIEYIYFIGLIPLATLIHLTDKWLVKEDMEDSSEQR